MMTVEPQKGSDNPIRTLNNYLDRVKIMYPAHHSVFDEWNDQLNMVWGLRWEYIGGAVPAGLKSARHGTYSRLGGR